VEHLLRLAAVLPVLKDTGCLFVTSAVESLDDAVLLRFAKGHTRKDVEAVVRRFADAGLVLNPTFVTFTPWTTPASYLGLLEALTAWNLVEQVAPIQYAIRLLIPAGSRLLELPDVGAMLEPFDSAALMFPWRHEDARVDALCRSVSDLVQRGEALKLTRTEIFSHIQRAARVASGNQEALSVVSSSKPSKAVPFLDEPWYCCAEPMSDQFVSIGAPKKQAAKTEQFV